MRTIYSYFYCDYTRGGGSLLRQQLLVMGVCWDSSYWCWGSTETAVIGVGESTEGSVVAGVGKGGVRVC